MTTTTIRPLENIPKSKTSSALVDATPFILIHFSLLTLLAVETSVADWICFAVIATVQMVAITVGYHRYFSHRGFKTGRVFQFILAFLAQTTAQKGALWWAAHHRDHHKYSDTEKDVHSPVADTFLYAHVGWIFDRRHDQTKFSKIRDFARFPELRFLNAVHLLPAVIVGVVLMSTLGLSGLMVGLILPIVFNWHGTFSINSLAHLWGTRPNKTEDHSRNNALLALLTAGEGWHNNHHHDMLNPRLGTQWWQFDLGWITIRVLEKLHIVSDVRGASPRLAKG